MTKREKAIRLFTKALKNASLEHMAMFGTFTPNMHYAWCLYVEACTEEHKDGKSSR